MKKVVLSIAVASIFTISSFSAAFAKPGKNEASPGQAKKVQVQVQIQPQQSNTTSSSIGESQPAPVKPGKSFEAPGQTKAQVQVNSTTPSAINVKTQAKGKATAPGAVKKEALPPVIKIGKLQISTNAVIKGFKATLVYDKASSTVTISKNGITITFVGDSKVFVNGVQVSLANVKNGSGKLEPMGFIQKTLNSKTKTTTGSAIDTTGSAITTGSAVNTTGSAISN